MTTYFSAATGGFYLSDVHAQIPADAVEISDAQHRQLLDEQANGKCLVGDEQGHPLAVDYGPPDGTGLAIPPQARRPAARV